MAETKARHRSTEEYKRDLVSEVCNLQSTKEDLLKQIHRAEIKLKGISTMITNLQQRKEDIQKQIDLVAEQFSQSNADKEALSQQMEKLRYEMAGIDEKLAIRYQMLSEANDTISAAKAKLEEMAQEHNKLKSIIGNDKEQQSTALQRNILATYNKMLTSSIEPLLPTLSDHQKEVLDDSGYTDLTSNGSHILNCAMLLALQYIEAATTYVNSHGGGGSTNLSGWGRDKDEDDEHWWRRCIAQSAVLIHPKGRKKGRGR